MRVLRQHLIQKKRRFLYSLRIGSDGILGQRQLKVRIALPPASRRRRFQNVYYPRKPITRKKVKKNTKISEIFLIIFLCFMAPKHVFQRDLTFLPPPTAI